MGVFDFLKKKEKKASLPPLPDMSTLPPLPEKPGTPPPQAPKPPVEEPKKEVSLPREDSPLFPDIPEEPPKEEPPKVAVKPLEETKPLEKPVEEVPDKIPDLEDLPEPPAFKEGKVEVQPLEIPTPGIPERIPSLEGFPEAPLPIQPPKKEHLVRHKVAKGPLFVKMDEYKALLEDIEQMRVGFKQNENIYVRMNDYRTEQDKAFEHFHGSLEDIQRKLMYVDKTLFEAE